MRSSSSRPTATATSTTLSWRETKYANHVNILNGENYMVNVDDGVRRSDVTINDNTIFVNMEDGVVYTGRDEVPDVVDAEVAYVVEDDHTRDVAEIVYILDGHYRDADRIFFVITDEDRETVEYDNDLYFEFDNTYVDGRPYEDLYVAYDALIDQRTVDIESLEGYDDYEDDNDAVSAEIRNELAGKVIEVLDSDNGYATEIRVHYEWAAPIVADDSALDLSWTLWNPEADNRNPVGYNTGDETTYVMIYEEYNSNSNPTRVTGYDVDVCDVDDIIEWTDNDPATDEDGRATLVNVVKDDDGEAQLVYVYNFDPDYHFRTVTINVYDKPYGTGYLPCWLWQSGVSVGSALSDFEQAMMDAGFNPVKNQYTYTIAGYEDEPEYKGDINSLDPDFAPIAVPYGHDDLVINITVENDDIACDAVDNLILDVTPVDVATPAISIDMANYGTIRYGFGITVPSDEEVTSVRWLETIVNENGDSNEDWKSATITADTALVTDNGNGTKTYRIWASAAGEFASGDVYVVRVSQAVINPDDQTDEGVYENGNDALIIAGGPADPTSLWNDARNYQFKLETPLTEYNELVKAMAVTEGEERETVTKWYVDYTESVSINGGEPYTTEQTREVAEDGVVSTVVDEKVPDFSATDEIVITITITKVYSKDVEVEYDPQTYTLKLEGALADDADVWSEDGKTQLNTDSNTQEDINGNKTITLNTKEIIIKVANGALPVGTYWYNGKIVEIETDDQWPVTLTEETTTLTGVPTQTVVSVEVADGIKLEGVTDADKKAVVKEENGVMYVAGSANMKVTLTAPVKTAGVFTDDDKVMTNGTKENGDTINITGTTDVYLKPVAKVDLDSMTSAAYGEQEFDKDSANYYVTGIVLTLDAGKYIAFENIDNKGYGVGRETYEVGYEDVTLKSGHVVTLGEGVSATVDGQSLVEGNKIGAQTDTDLSAVLKPDETIGTTVVVKTDDTVPYATAVGTGKITGSCTVVAMTKVVFPEGVHCEI